MRGQAGFFDIDERLKEISAKGDDLERLNAIVNFEAFRPDLVRAVPRSDGSKGGASTFRSCVYVEGADPAGEPLAVGRADRVPDQGQVVVHAVSRG
jgi:hypothetical protein